MADLTKWILYILVMDIENSLNGDIMVIGFPTSRSDRHPTVESQSKFFQDFFSVQLSPHNFEFGHVCEDPDSWQQRYESNDFKTHRNKGKVRWGDSKGAYGEHYWDLNHAGATLDDDDNKNNIMNTEPLYEKDYTHQEIDEPEHHALLQYVDLNDDVERNENDPYTNQNNKNNEHANSEIEHTDSEPKAGSEIENPITESNDEPIELQNNIPINDKSYWTNTPVEIIDAKPIRSINNLNEEEHFIIKKNNLHKPNELIIISETNGQNDKLSDIQKIFTAAGKIKTDFARDLLNYGHIFNNQNQDSETQINSDYSDSERSSSNKVENVQIHNGHNYGQSNTTPQGDDYEKQDDNVPKLFIY